jgi:hypothetical protein
MNHLASHMCESVFFVSVGDTDHLVEFARKVRTLDNAYILLFVDTVMPPHVPFVVVSRNVSHQQIVVMARTMHRPAHFYSAGRWDYADSAHWWHSRHYSAPHLSVVQDPPVAQGYHPPAVPDGTWIPPVPVVNGVNGVSGVVAASATEGGAADMSSSDGVDDAASAGVDNTSSGDNEWPTLTKPTE